MWTLSCSNIHLDYYLAWHCHFWNCILADSRNAVKSFVSSVKDNMSWKNTSTEVNSFAQKYFEKCLWGKLQLEIKRQKSSRTETTTENFNTSLRTGKICPTWDSPTSPSLSHPQKTMVNHTETLRLPQLHSRCLEVNAVLGISLEAACTCFHLRLLQSVIKMQMRV